jgi:hypothetical protein
MTLLKWLLILAVLGYGGLLTLMYVFQRALMYFPDGRRALPARAGLPQAEEVTFKSTDGETLIAWHVPPRGNKPVVLYFQGNAGGLDLRAERFKWLSAGSTGLVALCYRGYGGSSGKPSEAGLIQDARAAYDFSAARYAPSRLVIFGESLGTAVAIALAAERPVAGVILDAPFTSAVAIGAAAYPFAPVRLLTKDQWRSDQRIARINAPVLVLHGDKDPIVSIRFGEALFALANEPKRMVRFADGGHVNLDDFGAANVVKKFLAEMPAPPPPG